MKGLIRLHPQAAGPDGDVDGAGDSGSGESDVEEHVEVERRLDHDLSRFEMVQLPATPAADDSEDEDARATRLEEENLNLRAHLFLGLVPMSSFLAFLQWGGRTHFVLALLRQIPEV